MISFQPTEEELLTQSLMRSLAVEIIRPAALAADRDSAISQAVLGQIWQTGLVEALLTPATDPDPRSRVLSCIIYEELGWGDTATALAVAATMGFVQAIIDYGSVAQKESLRQSFAGERFRPGVVLVQEAKFGFDIASMATRVERTGDGYRLQGAKSFVPFAGRCQQMLVVARSGEGLDAFIVPVSAQGVEIAEARGTLGLKSLQFADVTFNNVLLPCSARLGENVRGDIHTLLASARVAISSILTGLARAVFEHITPYTQDRVAHGSALAKKQSVAFRLADMFIDIPSMRWLCWQAAAALAKGRRASREARLAQLHCAERAVWIADEGVQLMGGHGYMRANPVERWYRDARTLSLLEGVAGV